MMTPWCVPTVISALIWMWIFQPQYGLMRYIVSVLTFGQVGLMSGLDSTVAILGLFGLGEVTVQRGQTVAKGDVVGKATDQHDLIYEVRIGNKSVNPEKILSGKSGLQYKENM